jgi:hypothetical protein
MHTHAAPDSIPGARAASPPTRAADTDAAYATAAVGSPLSTFTVSPRATLPLPALAPVPDTPLERLQAVLYYEDPAAVAALLARADGNADAALGLYLAPEPPEPPEPAVAAAMPSTTVAEPSTALAPATEAPDLRSRARSVETIPHTARHHLARATTTAEVHTSGGTLRWLRPASRKADPATCSMLRCGCGHGAAVTVA